MGETDNKEVNITYETLFEILRREKDKEELQKLSESFFIDVIAYLGEKNNSAKDMTLQSFEDKKKHENELENIHRILKDVYERREKKIVNLALNISRTKSNLIDTSSLLKEEKGLFDCLIRGLDCGREEILNNLLESKTPSFQEPKIEKPVEENKEPKTGKEDPETPSVSEPAQTAPSSDNTKPEAKEQRSTKMVRFVNAVPKFVGKELEEYGPFDEEDIANIPIELANVLIQKGRAEEIEEQ